MKFIDMFCGIGTIRMGFEKAGWECVYSIEWDKHKRRIYSVIFGNEPEGRDIRECRGADIPRADCWCFGAPCQDFSIAGARAGLEGDRSSLVREVFRLLREIKEEHRPRYLLYENVKGMLSSNKGLDYLEILFEMESLGYDIEWQLLNSKYFGVPQNRERVFTIGHLRGRSTRKIFPIGGNNKEIGIKELAKINPNRHSSLMNSVLDSTGICPTLDCMQGGNRQPKVLICGNVNPSGKGMNGQVYDIDGLSATLTTNKGEGAKILIRENTKKGYVEAYEGDGIRLDHIGGTTGRARVQPQISNTLTTGSHAGVIEKGFRIRKLTPRECFRLQGVHDSITNKVIEAGISDAQMYRGAGDACTVNVIYEIAKRLS